MSTQAPSILLIEDDPQIVRFLRASLQANGYQLITASTGQEGLSLASTRPVEAILLDLGLPDIDGLSVAQRIREWSQVPMIVISARGREDDKIAALDGGADDYVTKPFSIPELLARLRVALRHAARLASAAENPVFTISDLRIDVARREVSVGDRKIHLTPTEFKLLVLLARNPGRVLTHRQLLQEVWGQSHGANTHYLRVQMYGLRHKLEESPSRPRFITTEPGIGYRLNDL